MKNEKPQNIKTAVYLRTATVENGERNIQKQMKAVTNFFAENTQYLYNPKLVFIDKGVSGISLLNERCAFRELLTNTEKVNCILVTDFSRISSNYAYLHKVVTDFKKKKIAILTVNNSPMEVFLISLSGAMTEFSNKIRRDVKNKYLTNKIKTV